MLKNSIDKIVKDKLSGVEVKPPTYVWTAINQHMLEGKQRKRILLYWQSAAAIALLMLSIGVIYFASNGIVQKKQMAIVENISTINGSKSIDKVIPKDTEERNNNKPVESATSVDKNEVNRMAGTTNQASVVSSESNTSEIIAEEKSITVNQPIIVQSSERYMSKLDYLSVFADGESQPDTKLIMVEKSTTQSSTLYAYNAELPTYKPNAKKYKFVLGGSVSPTYNYRSLDESQNSSVVRSAYDFPANETGIISVSGGVNIRMEGKSRWSFETGVLYSQVGQEVSNSTSYQSIAAVASMDALYSNSSNDVSVSRVSGVSNSLGEINYNNNTSVGVEKSFQKSGVYLAAPLNEYEITSDITIKQLLDYIEIPMMVRYAVFNNKPIVTLAGGFSTNFLVDNTAYVIENGEQINAGETEGINSITYSSSVGIGLELPLGKSFRFSLEPRFKYYITPVNSQGYNSFRPYSFGIFGGVSFIINNH